MYVIKRNGNEELVNFNKIVEKLTNLSKGLDIDVNLVAQKVVANMKSGMTTSELDMLSADIAVAMNGDYEILASNLLINDMHKKKTDFNEKCNYNNDYNYTYFGIKTLQNGYLGKGETPQDLLWRVTNFIYTDTQKEEAYKLMSEGYYTHATPTLYNSGKEKPQLSSCFLLHLNDDSIDGIYKTLWDCAKISKYAGGIGLSIHNLRGTGATVNGNEKACTGIVPMLKNFNDTARYVNQGGKRPGSIAIYLQIDHPDIFEFLDLRKNSGDDNIRCRDLFYAAWIPDLFMNKVKNNEDWYLFCPHTAPGLYETYGDEYTQLYEKYVEEKKFVKKVNAQELWKAICQSQIETGTPYILYKDAVNNKNMQQNLGTIKSSNLCCEIVQYTDKDEIAVCNLASIALPKFLTEVTEEHLLIYSKDNCKYCTYLKTYLNNIGIKYGVKEISEEDKEQFKKEHNYKTFPLVYTKEFKKIGGFEETLKYVSPKFDYKKLQEVVKNVVRGLNNVIDKNFYPVKEAEYSNKKNRPIGIGVQGLADVYARMNIAFDSKEATDVNKKIFETIYYAAVKESMEQAKVNGPYDSYEGSPVSKGLLNYDLWNVTPTYMKQEFEELKQEVQKYGVRNSLLVAPMPTASTSQILGNNEAFEPFTTNLYVRRTMAGEFMVFNKHLYKVLKNLNLWSETMKKSIIANKGSIQNIENIPDCVKDTYKTVWELSQKVLIDQAADRAPYVDQTQSMNLFIAHPSVSKLSSMHFYSWSKGLKTGIYYLRTQPVSDVMQFTVRKDTTCVGCSA